MEKYLVACPIGEPQRTYLGAMMTQVGRVSGKNSYEERLFPHVTLHPPVVGVVEATFLEMLSYLLVGQPRVEVKTGMVLFFGLEYLVVQVCPSLSLARLWVGLHDRILKLPGQKVGAYENENTLHITLGKGLSGVSNEIRSGLIRVPFERQTITLDRVVVYKKIDGLKFWTVVREFELAAI